jgi:hypothetical protein
MLWYRKSLRICEELWFATAGFRKHLSLLFAMIFGSQKGTICSSEWLLLFFYYDFKIVYKLDRSHLMVDALSRLPNQVELIGVFD